jgi:hypothetical protein
MKKQLVLWILAAVLAFAVSASAVEKIYFGDVGENKIRRSSLTGSNIEQLVTTGLDAVGSIALDRTRGKMYWADWTSSHIRRANLDGSNVETVVSGLSGPYGVAIDASAGKLYWTEFSSNVIRRSDLDGNDIEDLVTTGLSHVNGIALDLAGGKMYWTQSAAIKRANLDGSSIDDLVTTGLSMPMEIALDVAAGKMYWADLGTHKVQRANLDGTGVEDLVATGLDLAVGIDIDPAAGYIYFSDTGSSYAKIKRANLDGTSVVDLISAGIGSCYGLTLGPDTAECGDAWLDGPWITRVIGAAPYDYSVYMIFDGFGTIDELGSFSTPDSAGEYSVDIDCNVTGYIWADGYTPFTGYFDSDTLLQLTVDTLGPLPTYKVMAPWLTSGCWEGTFVQDETAVSYTVELNLDGTGAITSSTGLLPPVTGRILYEPPYLAGHIITGEAAPWNEINIRDATMISDIAMTGTFGVDCSDCPGGTFTLYNCEASGINDRASAGALALHPNYPNPFNPRTTIAYTLPETGYVSLRVYDAAGRMIKTLVNMVEAAGPHAATWDGRDAAGADVSSGVYFVRLESGGGVQTRKVVLLK